MKHQYISPQVEFINVNASCNLLAGSAAPGPVSGGKSLPVVSVPESFTAE